MVSNRRFKRFLKALGVTEYLALGEYKVWSNGGGELQKIKNNLETEIARLDEDDNNIIADLGLLLDHLGLEIQESDKRTITKKKKGKK